MRDMEVNGVKVKTNYGGNYAVWNGNDYPKTMRVHNIPFGMSDREYLEELVAKGYRRIRFVEMTTCVRGYHNVYAFVK